MTNRNADGGVVPSDDWLRTPIPAVACTRPGNEAAPRVKRILAEAHRLVASGALEAVTAIGVLHARRATGEATTDLLLEMGTAPTLLHPIGAGLGDGLDLVRAHHRSQVADIERGRATAGNVLAAVRHSLVRLNASHLLVGAAITAPVGRLAAHPLVTLVLAARGADGAEQLVRLDCSHPHDVAANVSRIVERHRSACLVASRRSAKNVDWEADEIALRIISKLGGNPGDVMARLEHHHRVAFRLPSGHAGSLLWRDFALTAELRRAGDWRYLDGTLVVPSQSLPEAVLASMPGNALGSFVSVHPSLDEVRVSVAEASPMGGLRIELDPRRTGFPFRAMR